MRVVVLHSAVANDARPDDLDTLNTASAIAEELRALGHAASLAPFALSVDSLEETIRLMRPEAIFNFVETVAGQDSLAGAAPAILDKLGVPYTGSGAATISLAGDKPLAKHLLRTAGLPTPDWVEPAHWDAIQDGRRYVVKSATEDASLGLDDEAVVMGRVAVADRAHQCAVRWGGRWFAEAFVEGREFNVAIIEEQGDAHILPIPEMRFENWPPEKPRIVGYRAKWDAESDESKKTVRAFGVERQSPELAEELAHLALRTYRLFGAKGYARVDFRVDKVGKPTILEMNPNPSLDPDAGFAAAAKEADLPYRQLIATVLAAAFRK